MAKKKPAKVTVSLPYPYTAIEFIPKEKFEKWILTVAPELQAAVREQWEKGQK